MQTVTGSKWMATAQWVQRPTEKPGTILTILMWVRVDVCIDSICAFLIAMTVFVLF